MPDAVERAISRAHAECPGSIVTEGDSCVFMRGETCDWPGHAAIDRLVALVRLEQATIMCEMNMTDAKREAEYQKCRAEAARVAGKDGAR